MNKFLQKYNGKLRNIKLFYWLYNRLNAKKLQHNIHIYRKYGLKKSIFGSIDAQDFIEVETIEKPWLDSFDAYKKLEECDEFEQLSGELKAAISSWNARGYLRLNSFFEDNKIDALNKEIDRLIANKKIASNYTGTKFMQVHKQSPIANDIFKDERLLKIMSFILQKEMIPFQTINFIKGSEQKPHSDYLHMSTFPNGYLLAAWIALEDIHENSGPLFFFPGSHKYPYFNKKDIWGYQKSKFFNDGNLNEKYETHITEYMKKRTLMPKVFYAKKGDVLIWHHNLVHGGLPVKDKLLTRKSMVCHYFAKDVVAYHEISSRPALIDNYEA